MKKHAPLLTGSLVLIELIAMPAFSSSNQQPQTTLIENSVNVLSSVELNSQQFKKFNPQKNYPQVATSCSPWPECEDLDSTNSTESKSKT